MAKVSRKSLKIRASGFNNFTSPESITPRNHFKNANRFSATGKVSADQLLSAYKGTLREFSSARISTVPEIGPASISSYRPNQASINSAACGCTCFSAAQPSANGRPASCSSFHDCVHTVARNSSIASLSPSKSLRYKYRGSQSISTPPRSNTAIERPAISRPILADRSGPFEVLRGPAHASRPTKETIPPLPQTIFAKKNLSSRASRGTCFSLEGAGRNPPSTVNRQGTASAVPPKRK